MPAVMTSGVQTSMSIAKLSAVLAGKSCQMALQSQVQPGQARLRGLRCSLPGLHLQRRAAALTQMAPRWAS